MSALQEAYNSFKYFLGRLQSFLGIDNPHRHQKASGPGQSKWSIHFFTPLNSLSLDLIMSFPIPYDDMLIFSSFAYNLILCRNVPLLFVDAVLFKQASLYWNSKLLPCSLERPRSVLNQKALIVLRF